MKTRFILALAVATMLLPTSAASWLAYGGYEPDSKNHDDAKYMWFDAPGVNGVPSNAVYFNAFNTMLESTNENLGALKSRVQPTPEFFWNAMLGQWTDCNGDNYVGLAESALDEYPVQVLDQAGLDRCPVGGAHNGGGWVNELTWIGTDAYGGHPDPRDPTVNGGDRKNVENDPRIYVDPQAAIWGDQGLPGAVTLGGSCALAVLPQGMFQSTGGLLNYLDCFDSYNVAKTLAGQNPQAPVPNTGLGPASPGANNPWRQPSTLNHKTFGDDNCPTADPGHGTPCSTDNSIVEYTDCSQDPMWKGVDPTYQSVRDTNPTVTENTPSFDFTKQGPRPPAPAVHNQPDPTNGGVTPGEWAGGNVPSTYNATTEQLDPTQDCGKEDQNAAKANAGGDGQNFFYGGLLGESSNEQAGVSLKTSSDLEFNFSAQERGRAWTGIGDPIDPVSYPSGLEGTPDSLGTEAFNFLVPLGQHEGTHWRSNGGFAATPQGVSRSTVISQNVEWWTFYARVGSATHALGTTPTAGDTHYGQYAGECTTVGAGHHEPATGWECDPTAWNVDALGNPVAQPYHFGIVGDLYQMRDIDCYDGAVISDPVTVGFPASGMAKTCDEQ